MDLLSFGLFCANALALAVVAVQNYKNSGTLEMMKSFNNYFLSYVLAWLLVFLLAFSLPTSAKIDGAQPAGNLKLLANGIGLLLCPAFIPVLLIFAYVFVKIPGNESRLSYALFALLFLQQLWYAMDASDPRKAMLWLGMLYSAGFFIVIFFAAMAGGLLARALPGAERRHEEWVQQALADPEFGKGDDAARMIIMNLRASTPRTTAPGPNETQYVYNPRSRPIFTWKPSQVAAALVLFSIWSALIYAFPILI